MSKLRQWLSVFLNIITLCIIFCAWELGAVQSFEAIESKTEALAKNHQEYQWELIRTNSVGKIQFRTLVSGEYLMEESFYEASPEIPFPPYSKIVKLYSSNQCQVFRQGAIREKGEVVASEAEFEANSPLFGLGLFASPRHLIKLFHQIRNTQVRDDNLDGEDVSVIEGEIVQFGRIVRLSLAISKRDGLLLQQAVSMSNAPEFVKKLIGKRAVADAFWLYESCYLEVWNSGKIISKTPFNITIQRKHRNSDDKLPNIEIPIGTSITDTRFGYGVVYRNGIDRFADEELAKMSTDFDYRTNSYYIGRMKPRLQTGVSTTVSQEKKRILILLSVFIVGVVPLSLFVLVRRGQLGNHQNR